MRGQGAGAEGRWGVYHAKVMIRVRMRDPNDFHFFRRPQLNIDPSGVSHHRRRVSCHADQLLPCPLSCRQRSSPTAMIRDEVDSPQSNNSAPPSSYRREEGWR
jgi:hypothetical protein